MMVDAIRLLNRRALLGAAPVALISGAAMGVTSCATGSAALTPAQVIADAQGVTSGLGVALAGIAAAAPTLIPAATLAQLQAGLTQAAGLLTTVSSATAATTGASVLAQVEAAANAVLRFVAGLPIPAPYSTIVQAAAVVVPVIEAFVGQYIPSAAVAGAPAGTSVAAARAVLGVPTL